VIGDVEVLDAGAKGRGVYARRPFAEGEFIFRRRHTRVVIAEDLPTLSEWERIHLCELGFDRFGVLAPPGCYLNHSCEPNAMRHGVNLRLAIGRRRRGDNDRPPPQRLRRRPLAMRLRLGALPRDRCRKLLLNGCGPPEIVPAIRSVVHPARAPATQPSAAGCGSAYAALTTAHRAGRPRISLPNLGARDSKHGRNAPSERRVQSGDRGTHCQHPTPGPSERAGAASRPA